MKQLTNPQIEDLINRLRHEATQMTDPKYLELMNIQIEGLKAILNLKEEPKGEQ